MPKAKLPAKKQEIDENEEDNAAKQPVTGSVAEEESEGKPKIVVDPKQAAIDHAKTLVPVAKVEGFGNNLTLVPYQQTEITKFGSSFVVSLVAQAGMEAEAAAQLAAAGEAKQYLSFEMTRAIFDLAHKFGEVKGAQNVDVYSVFGESKDVEKLNTRVLVHLGVLKREVDEDDSVVYRWTDPIVEGLYAYGKDLKEKDKAEFDKRFNNRKRLNSRLQDAYKTVAVLLDNKLSPDDLYYSEDKETQSLVPTIRNAPKEIGGVAGTVQLGARKPVTGADMSPTMASLISLANKKHKGPKADRADKGENREGEAKMGMTDETFGGIINTARRAITAQESVFSEEMLKQMKAFASFLNAVIGEVK